MFNKSFPIPCFLYPAPLIRRDAFTYATGLMDIFSFNDYRSFLKGVLAMRCERNVKYSLRAFARDLGVGAPRLSEVLHGHRNFSTRTLSRIAERIGLVSLEIEYLEALAKLDDSKDETSRKVAQARLSRFRDRPHYAEIQKDFEGFLGAWYHMAIMELTDLSTFSMDPKWIAATLHITQDEARDAIARLFRLNLLVEEHGAYSKRFSNYATRHDVPSAAARNFHRQVLGLAKSALASQSQDEREFSSSMFVIDSARIPEAKLMLRRFRRDLAALSTPGAADEVYALGTQFFRVSHNVRGGLDAES